MKKSILSLLTLLVSFQIFAQISIRIGVHEPVRSNAGWTVPKTSFASVAEGQAIIYDILEAVDRKANFEIRSTTSIDNAAAVSYGGKRYVLYNPNFINSLVRTSSNKWSAISVLAHEVGHHLEGHTSANQGSHPTIELEADEFSGYALRKMGASLADAQSAMRLIASNRASSTHPAKHNRLAAIEDGWSMADQQMGSTAKTNRRPVETNRNPYPQPNTGNQGRTQTGSVSLADILIGILGQVLSSGNVQNGGYVVNNQSDVMRRVNNKWYSVGKLVRTNDSRYPLMIKSSGGSQLLVNRQGKIVNMAGQVLGMLQTLRG